MTTAPSTWITFTSAQNLAGPQTNMHIHCSLANASGHEGPYTVQLPKNMGASALFPVVLSPSRVADLVTSGASWINVHSTAAAAGEIAGPVLSNFVPPPPLPPSPPSPSPPPPTMMSPTGNVTSGAAERTSTAAALLAAVLTAAAVAL